jgi:beta-lactamase superfamily II metal-dependent hydrolase
MAYLFVLLVALLAPQEPALTIGFLDVGQADATVVESPEGRIALIDGGRDFAALAEALLRWEVDTVDLVVASHADADHIGGLEAVLWTVPVRYYLDNGRPHTTATYRSLMRTVERSQVTYLAPVARTITLGSVTLRVLPPPDGPGEQNDASVGILIEYGEFRALLVGDAEQDELHHFLQLGIPPVSVLKASHHGARNGVTPAWVAATNPRVVVISVDQDNAYGHPDPWALRYYEAKADAIFRTDRDGALWLTASRDGTFRVETDSTLARAMPSRTFAPRQAR